ncbi:hypothetical protein KAH43_01270 [Candidatus Bipolaricaulota bacterium]|nr:hypothetical protein [Candidatus Bipolaricaulota bacterium]
MPITWDLFQGEPPQYAAQYTEAAGIHTSIRWGYSYSTTQSKNTTWICQTTDITVSHTMQPSLSWVFKENSDPGLLWHEQLHFDLSEIYARKLELLLWEIAPTVGETSDNANHLHYQAYQQVGNTLLQKLKEMVSLYDLQTEHSNNVAEQARWQGLISQWLLAPSTAP